MGREDYTVNGQERDEIAELILRAVRLNFDAGVAHATRHLPIESLMKADDNAHTAQRELWEALYGLRLDHTLKDHQRTSATDPHDAKPVV